MSSPDRPSITVIVTKAKFEGGAHYLGTSLVGPTGPISPMANPRPYHATTVPFSEKFQASGSSPEDAIRGLMAVIGSFYRGGDRELVQILSVPLDELLVEEVLGS